jgi:hypothetical protein
MFPPPMSTNYYVRPHRLWMFEPEQEQSLHLGKSSAGWCFLLRVYPERGINDLSDWLPVLRGSEYNDPAIIFDEYGESVSYNEMVEIITRRSGKRWEVDQAQSKMICVGPNGLLRYAECQGMQLCVWHGAGTWDCVEGDFS